MKICPECDGEGQHFAGNVAKFNSRTMEVEAGEEYETCGRCEGEGEIDEQEEEEEDE